MTAAQLWSELNQRHLATALGQVFNCLQRHCAQLHGTAVELATDQEQDDLPGSGGRLPALETLCAAFQLSPFERNLLLLCGGVELDSRFGALCATAHGDPQRVYPTFSLALAALPGAHWSALTPGAALRRWNLIEVEKGGVLTLSPLRISERVLHYLAGTPHPDERLAGIVRPVQGSGQLVPSHQALVAQLNAAWSQPPGAGPLPVVQLCGDDSAGKRGIAAAACGSLGLSLWRASATALPTLPSEVEAFARLWEREAVLTHSALLVDCDDLEATDGQRAAAVTQLIERISGVLILSSVERWRALERPMTTLDIQRPGAAEQRVVWHEALGPLAAQLNGQVDQLIGQFNLGAQAIRSAAAEAALLLAGPGQGDPGRVVWEVCRAQGRVRLEDLAQRIDSAATWDDLVLPSAQRQILGDVAAHVRQRMQVYESWGFAGKGGRGLGISAMFAGSSGTGKTLAAEVLANELRLDLYRIDLSSVVSKYIGETEKNLRRIFDAAEAGGAILLFDEADALFGKRSEVKDSHDRHANIEVSYLLQRMEAYRGLAVLTTNMKNAIDSAFLRRIRFVVQFPFPDASQRAGIWRCIFPRATPTEGLDYDRLARLNVAGGNIRSIALNGAFLAADAGQPVRMAHLLRAARSEYAKLEKPLAEAEIAGWV